MGSWYIDTTRIIVTDLEEEDKAIIAKLSPLGGGTVHQYWGWDESPINVKAFVVGKSDKDDLTSKVRDGTTHLLIGSGFSNPDWDRSTTIFIEDIKWSALGMICQTIRPDLPTDARVYSAVIVLSTEEYSDV